MRSGFVFGCCLALAAAALPAAAQAGTAPGTMRVGLTIVAGPPEALPEPASLDYPASPNAVMCRSDSAGYRECRTPFRGDVQLSREVTATRCIEGTNWGRRDGAVWVDRGCGAVFVRAGS